MKISVVTPTKDRPEAVELCRRWIREQAYPVHEHIVVDGGLNRDNLREGILQATGDVVLLADDDDYYTPSWTDWIADAYADPKIRATGQREHGMHHIRAASRQVGVRSPRAGTLSFRIEEREAVLRLIPRPKLILRMVAHRVFDRPFCQRIMGLYPSPGPGRGQSRKHNPDRFPIPDPGLRVLRERIGDVAVQAYLEAIKRIDARLAG